MTTDQRDRCDHLGMKPSDVEDKPYTEYWNPDMAPLPDHVQRALTHGAEAAELGFDISDIDQLLEPGYLPMETGFTRLSNGQVYVSCLTDMPGVTAEMIDWWMGWHYMEDQRYKLWHPRAHVSTSAERMVGDDPDLSDREKYLHNPNYITEYVGDAKMDLTIEFSEPSTYFDVDAFATAGIGTAICGTVGRGRRGVDFASLIHLIRATRDGVEMRSRFWLGSIAIQRFSEDGVVNRLVRTELVARRATSLAMGRDLLVHCASEMNHLAAFLPDLYRDYHPEEES